MVVAVGDVLDGSGDKVGGGEDFEIALGFPVVAGAVDDGGGLFVPGDFLQGEGGAPKVFGELAAAIDVVCCDGFFSGIEAGATYVNRPSGATTGAWPGVNPFGGWKGSGATGPAGLS